TEAPRRKHRSEARLPRPPRASGGPRAGGAPHHGRSPDRQGYRNASPGALAIPRRHRGAGQKAFLFTRVTDAKRRKYEIPVVVGALAASREIYRIGMGCALDGINETWNRAMAKPIAPRIVEDAPCHEVVIEGSDLDKPGMGL